MTPIGPHVSTVKEGDQIQLESGSFCGHCDNCRNGRVDLCNRAPHIWFNESMGYADYILAPRAYQVRFEGLDFEVACVTEPLGVAFDFDANNFRFNKLQLRASFASPALYFPYCLQLLKDGLVDGRAIISHVVPLEHFEEVIMLLRDQRMLALKIVITA